MVSDNGYKPLKEQKYLGKIKSAEIGFEDDNFQRPLVAKFVLSGGGYAVDTTLPVEEVHNLMIKANAARFQSLVGKPIWWVKADGLLGAWGILEECI